MSDPIFIASDHAGYTLKSALQKAITEVKWQDLGPANTDRVDYPDFAQALSEKIIANPGRLGVLICGSGIGMAITANKFTGIRAALVENPVSARLSREHNDANVLCLGARFLASEYAADIVRAWLGASFSHEGRHEARVKKISAIEKRR